MKKMLWIPALFLCSGIALFAQSLPGTWQGAYDVHSWDPSKEPADSVESLPVVLAPVARSSNAYLDYNRLYAEYFATARPCRTTVGVTALPTPIAIELKCIAEVRSP